MSKKGAKKSRKNKKIQARMILIVLFLAVLFTVVVANMAFDWFSLCKKSDREITESQIQRTGLKVYDINVPGSFFTFRNMGSSPIPGSSIRILINGAEVQCHERIDDLEPAETRICTNPLVKICKEIKIIGTENEDIAYCE